MPACFAADLCAPGHARHVFLPAGTLTFRISGFVTDAWPLIGREPETE
jgi:hypothetical protein